ncbi:lipid-A-disaccharide synthase [Bacteriovoracaceae bacterium]|nr:lipid-A-disaccharide synthase [Bacteriovoracaceae bacterium]
MNKKQSCLIIAGEKSGEEHAESFLPSLINELPEYQFYGLGGERFNKLGVDLIADLSELSTWGITGALKKIPFYLKLLDQVVEEVKKRETKVAILIDYQGFNLKLAEKISPLGVKVLYYVAPQAWGWKPWRVKKLINFTHTLFTIIPFEKKWFQDRGVQKVISAPHPIYINHLDKKKNFKRESLSLNNKKEINILLLPGSRNSEVRTLLPLMIETLQKLKVKYTQISSTLIKSPSVKEKYYDIYSDEIDHIKNNENLIEELKTADLCIAASGTVTLFAAFFYLPTVVIYKTDLFTSLVIRTLQIYHGPAALSNIFLDQSYVYPELIQEDATSAQLLYQVDNFIFDYQKYRDTIERLQKIDLKMKGEGISIKEYMLAEISKSYED